MRFEFATAGQILFGEGTLREVAPAVSRFSRALVVTGRAHERAAQLTSALAAAGVVPVLFSIGGEPTLDTVREGVAHGRENQTDVVIGFGGGSAIDAGKAIAALLTNSGDVLDYLEVVGKGQALARHPAPFVAVPTTAGTGSEVTRNAVLASPAHQVKASLRSPMMLPSLAVVDPELTYDLPASVTAATGLDALTQLIEPYVSIRANPMTDAFCVDGMRRVSGSLLRACREGRDRDARREMSLASLLGGLALANAGLGAVHGFAGPIGGMFPAPHGAVCAALLPHVMAVNIKTLRARSSESDPVARYRTVARILTGTAEAAPEDGAAWVAEMCASLCIPPLRSYGIEDRDVPLLVERAAHASSMKGNPIVLTAAELSVILTRAL
jgi:alcohol dehydrogenase class IV